uniref:Small ribosomal subunit protein uS14m n=1 Tax=Chlorokybus atmophyticus TaxID=3144 RepID=A6YEC1_CHLAT|nr:ribosomal protein S14 [Chlorokybus atmophyticus]ABO15118.1 ribosomal protein S14 [Chlorokybus atmophyticus]
MSNSISRDNKRRTLVAQYEYKRIQYKAILNDLSIPNDLRYKYALKLAKLPRNSSKTRIKNRCILTGRPKAVYKKFRLSRIVFRELASKGLLVGVTKSSW